MEGALRRAFFAFEVLEKVVHDLTVVEADLGKLAAADLDDLVDPSLLAGVPIVDLRIVRVIGAWVRDHLDPAQGGTMPVFAQLIASGA